jgi:hypothetical protein
LLLQLPVVDLGRQRPAQTGNLRAFQVSMNGRLCDVAAARDLLLGEPQAEAQPENFLILRMDNLLAGKSGGCPSRS